MSKDNIALTVVGALALIVIILDFMYWRPL
jgi:hypothetical protein